MEGPITRVIVYWDLDWGRIVMDTPPWFRAHLEGQRDLASVQRGPKQHV